MARHLTVQRSALSEGTAEAMGTWLLALTITSTSGGMVSPVFRTIREPIDPQAPSGPTIDVYQGVCTPAEISTLPINNPTAATGTFRASTASVYFRSVQAYEVGWTSIKGALGQLCLDLDNLGVLSIIETVTVP